MYIQFFKWILERQPTPLNPMPGFGTKAEALIRLFESIRCLTNSHRKAQSSHPCDINRMWSAPPRTCRIYT